VGVVRIHFTSADVARTHVAAEPDPLWELVLSLHVLQGENARRSYPEWRLALPKGEQRAVLRRIVRDLLAPLAPHGPYFPDFMTPVEALAGIDAGMDALVRTPRWRVKRELELLTPRPGAAGWLARVAEGRSETWRVVAAAMRTYFDLALRPFWPTIRGRVGAEYLVRSRFAADRGTVGVLDSLRPMLRWDDPVLEIAGPRDRDLHLDGRGLTIIPSYFNWSHAITMYNPELPPILLYPAATFSAFGTSDSSSNGAVAELLGATRAAALRAVATGCTTTELAEAIGVSPSTASEHARVLRRAGHITTTRHGQSVWHALTPLGAAVLSADNDP
jgi:DNA-binding transcriptional ArsR family regulator